MELPIIHSKEEFNEAKKLYTQLLNKFSKKSDKLAKKIIGNLAEIANKDFRYGDTSELSHAVWAFHCFHPYPKSVVKLSKNIELLKETYPALSLKGEELYLQLKEAAEYLVSFEEFLVTEKARLSNMIDIKAVLKKMASQDYEKRNALVKYANSLKNWEETIIVNGELIVNGVNVGKEAECGIRIGNGIRIHPMTIYVFHNEKENQDYIGIRNYTQWRQSSLMVFDLIANVPSDVISDRL